MRTGLAIKCVINAFLPISTYLYQFELRESLRAVASSATGGSRASARFNVVLRGDIVARERRAPLRRPAQRLQYY